MTVPTLPLPLALVLLLLVLQDGAGAASGPAAPDAPSPNFLVVMTDDCDMLTLQGMCLCV